MQKKIINKYYIEIDRIYPAIYVFAVIIEECEDKTIYCHELNNEFTKDINEYSSLYDLRWKPWFKNLKEFKKTFERIFKKEIIISPMPISLPASELGHMQYNIIRNTIRLNNDNYKSDPVQPPNYHHQAP